MWVAGQIVDQVEGRLWALDALRRAMFRVFAPVLGRYLADRQVRVAWLSAAVLVSSLALALGAPLVLLAVGPLVLGVPHLVADVRYLVLRPGLHQRTGAGWVAALLLATLLTRDLSVALLVPVPAALFARGGWARRLGAAAPWLAAAALAWGFRTEAAFAVGQGHNFVAALIWVLLGTSLHGGPGRHRVLWLAAFGATSLAIACGAFDGLLEVTRHWRLTGAETLRSHARGMAPFADPALQVRGVVLFAFAQSVHYGLWLRVVPEESRPRPGTRSFTTAFRALRRDTGDGLLAAALLAAGVFATWGLSAPAAARDGYLALAYFHGPLEFAVLTTWFVERTVATDGAGEYPAAEGAS